MKNTWCEHFPIYRSSPSEGNNSERPHITHLSCFHSSHMVKSEDPRLRFALDGNRHLGGGFETRPLLHLWVQIRIRGAYTNKHLDTLTTTNVCASRDAERERGKRERERERERKRWRERGRERRQCDIVSDRRAYVSGLKNDFITTRTAFSSHIFLLLESLTKLRSCTPQSEETKPQLLST